MIQRLSIAHLDFLFPSSTLPSTTITVMSSLPPHFTGRPLKPRPSKDSPEAQSDASLQPQQGQFTFTTLPPQGLGNLPVQSHDSREPPSSWDTRFMRKSIDTDGDTEMGGLEVCSSRPMPYTEQTSHGTAQQALAAMLRDADRYEADETRIELKRRDSGFMEFSSQEFASVAKLILPTKKQRKDAAPRDPNQQPLQSLAATHPSLYRQPLTQPDSRNSASNIPPTTSQEDVPQAQSTQPRRKNPPSWPVHSDPHEPGLPKPALVGRGVIAREDNRHSQLPNVVSPLRMATMPFDSMIEIAHDYKPDVDDDEYKAQGED